MDCLMDHICKKCQLIQRNHHVLHLTSREYQTNISCRKDQRLMRSIISGCSYSFRKIWAMKSPRRITCDGRFAFFNNYTTCVDCSSSQENPSKIFCLEMGNRLEKIEDAVIMEGTPESMNLPLEGHKACLLAVTASNWLLRMDLTSGDILERVKLSRPGVKFKKINWNNMDESFVLTSKQFPHQRMNRQRINTSTDFVHIILMSCMPMRFLAKFAVTTEVFGSNVVEAVVSLDILMLMYSTDHVRMFNLQSLLRENQTHQHQLYDKMSDGSIYGSEQSPLTHNLTLRECPPCILEVRCRHRDVMVTMPPCYYVMWPWSQSKGYCCYSVKTGQMVVNGCLEAEDDSLEEKVALHADDSGRIIQMKNSELRIFKLVPESEDSTYKLVEDFGIRLSQPAHLQGSTPNVTLSGRIIKKRVKENCQEISDRTVLSMMYSEDLNMIVLLSCSGETGNEEIQSTFIGFYDNWNGKLHGQFKLEDAPTEEVIEQFFTYEGDTITHVFKRLQGKMECHVYKLQPMVESPTLVQMSYKAKTRKDSSHSGRRIRR